MKGQSLKIVLLNIIIITFLLLLTSSNFTSAVAQEIKLPDIKKETLDNGLKVIVIEHHELPVVAFRLVLKSGSAYDPPGKAGLANLTAGLLRKGTKTKDATQIAEEIDFVGGTLGAGAGWDATFATCRVLNKYFDTGLDLLTDIILGIMLKRYCFFYRGQRCKYHVKYESRCCLTRPRC